MTVSHAEEWVQVAYLDQADHIRFTQEFQSVMGDLDWAAKAFVGHLLNRVSRSGEGEPPGEPLSNPARLEPRPPRITQGR
jgi:hypothetical protein